MLTQVKLIEIFEWNLIKNTSIIINKEDSCKNDKIWVKEIHICELNFDKKNSIITRVRNITVEVVEIQW